MTTRAAPAPPAASAETSPPEDRLPDDPDSALTTALDDLDDALQETPGFTAEQLLKMASRPGQDCMLVWNGGQPSLVFGKMPIGRNSIAATLEVCARAVKRLRR